MPTNEAPPSRLRFAQAVLPKEDIRSDTLTGLTPARDGFILSGRRGCSSMVELQPSKLAMRVRFPSPARRQTCAPVAQWTEQEPSKLLAGGSNPSGGAGLVKAW